ncbi:hypothetical protein NLG97_g3934 [Lecanicillium saksenae]|uniref:Uncharacterized protein n=1 Tax=Lecanicillium saksenae TaxID=468837 RepID=A0ACC1QXA5_9HYPO|nr:hypothetical protein NLG97_g3934 [Lecanicillium saksenae]
MHSVKSPYPCSKCELPTRRAMELERFPDEFSRERLKKMTAEALTKEEEEKANQVSEADITDATAKDI